MSPGKSVLITLFAAILILFALYSAYPVYTQFSQQMRFYAIGDELENALSRNDKEAVNRLASEYLALADNQKNDRNYGNAIHDANEALGIVALRENDLEKADQYLIKTGKTPGSPQLNSIGPKLELADALLKRGENDVVVEHLRLISRFWDPGRGKQCLPAVIRFIERGKQPSLNALFLFDECDNRSDRL